MPLNLTSKPIEPFNVLAFDPGGTTGWAWASLHAHTIKTSLEEYGIVILEDIYLETGEFENKPLGHYQELHEFITAAPTRLDTPLEIVFEPFTYRQFITEGKDGGPQASRHKVELISAEYIGVIKLACSQLGLIYYDRFTPGEAKSYVTDKKLELLGWLQTPITPRRHQNDALRQLVKYLIVRKGVKHPITTQWRRPT